MTETPTERRLREIVETRRAVEHEPMYSPAYNPEHVALTNAIDKGRQAIALLRECELEWFPDLIAREIRALLTACQEDA